MCSSRDSPVGTGQYCWAFVKKHRYREWKRLATNIRKKNLRDQVGTVFVEMHFSHILFLFTTCLFYNQNVEILTMENNFFFNRFCCWYYYFLFNNGNTIYIHFFMQNSNLFPLHFLLLYHMYFLFIFIAYQLLIEIHFHNEFIIQKSQSFHNYLHLFLFFYLISCINKNTAQLSSNRMTRILKCTKIFIHKRCTQK